MCGIYLSWSTSRQSTAPHTLLDYLRRRGPDSMRTTDRYWEQAVLGNSHLWHIEAISSVLSLRGPSASLQPLECLDLDSASQSFLCWNGEVWEYDGHGIDHCDSDFVFAELLQASKALMITDSSRSEGHASLRDVASSISRIRGPFAFVFYDSRAGRIFYGRDILGRRSLLFRQSSESSVELASVCDARGDVNWSEVEADGLYVLSLKAPLTVPASTVDEQSPAARSMFEILHIPWTQEDTRKSSSITMTVPFLPFNRCGGVTSRIDGPKLVAELFEVLQHAIALRVRIHAKTSAPESILAILFSGGIDCTILARIAHNVHPFTSCIELLNVAFENPRCVKAAQEIQRSGSISIDPYEICPDRITARKSFAILQQKCPERNWRFVTINVPYSETLQHRPIIRALIHPNHSEMDLSIGSALYFASRGIGTFKDPQHAQEEGVQYKSRARVLLSGLGADELFAGYARHAKIFRQRGHDALARELEADVRKLGKRNLGRDDRVTAHWAREIRYPYLDEKVVSWAFDIPLMHKCAFAYDSDSACGLPPDKRILRLLAERIGLSEVASEMKRAIQFGARTAKMESGKTKGHNDID